MRFRSCPKIVKCLPGFAIAVASIAFAGSVVQAEEPAPAAAAVSFGTIVGLVRDAAKAPIGGATVTAIRAGGGIRSTISGSDGIYSFADVPPGLWSLNITVEGSPDVRVPSLNVVAGTATRHDIVMNIAVTPKPAAPALASVAPVAVPKISEALQEPEPGPENDTQTPWANVGYVGWMNGTSREKSPIFDTKFFTPEVRLDINYLQSLNRPSDHTIDGSTEEFRSGEFQIEQVSLGGDFHWDNVRARFLSMFGMFATTTPRNDASSAVGQWQLSDAYRYFSEANAGYHFDVNHGLNVDAGVFVSYVGLFSYYNFDNWTYQPSFVSSNTPWFFNGLRVQWWPTQDLKIEPWLINGWQSYAKFNRHPGFGGQILWIPNENLKLVFNTYSIGQDNLNCQANNNNGQGTIDTLCQPQNGGNPNAAAGSFVGAGPPVNYANVTRFHEDDSVLVKYYDAKGQGGAGVSKMAFSLTWDFGCEYGGGVHCTAGPNKEEFLGVMLYDRTWFHNDLYAITLGGGFMNNPGRYLALTPPINGATAATGSPYFTQQPGQKLYQWDSQLNLQYMPKDWITWWTEVTFRHSSVPYWSGQGGITPPGGNNGSPASCVGGGADAATGQCSSGDWFPDLRTREIVLGGGVMVKF
ncbi:MAG TPA: TonB-dependent receptor [Steroidobacteraceae bacterium]|nr:TonB-dependent receptor [Steroidobacteraceae bacterium]